MHVTMYGVRCVSGGVTDRSNRSMYFTDRLFALSAFWYPLLYFNEPVMLRATIGKRKKKDVNREKKSHL